MKRHYDAIARNAREAFRGDDAEALRARSAGAAAPLKRFHNVIKRHLISLIACPNPGSVVLDMACGRGGDIHKYINVGAKLVVGVDVSPEEIAEARRRAEIAVSGERDPPKFEFVVADLFDATTPLVSDEKCDVASCMFALHYFAESEDTLRAALRLAHASLKPGGVFVGTASSGNAIDALLGGAREYLSPALRVERVSDREVSFVLRDTVVDYDDDARGSVEFLLDERVLDSVARRVGFERIDLGSLEGCLDPATGRFAPDFGPRTLPGLDVASGLFFAFAFRKKA